MYNSNYIIYQEYNEIILNTYDVDLLSKVSIHLYYQFKIIVKCINDSSSGLCITLFYYTIV